MTQPFRWSVRESVFGEPKETDAPAPYVVPYALGYTPPAPIPYVTPSPSFWWAASDALMFERVRLAASNRHLLPTLISFIGQGVPDDYDKVRVYPEIGALAWGRWQPDLEPLLPNEVATGVAE